MDIRTPKHGAAAVFLSFALAFTLGACSSGGFEKEVVAPRPPDPEQQRPAISLSGPSSEIAAEGGTVTVEIANDGGGSLSWSASLDATWAEIDGSTSGTGTASLSITVEENEDSQSSRTVTVTVRSNNASNSPQTLDLTQSPAAPPTLDASAADYSIEPDGETVTVDVTVSTADAEWELAAIGEDWARVLGKDEGSGSGSLSIEVDANDTGASRSLTLTVRLIDHREITAELHFSQSGAQLPALAVEADDYIAAAGGDTIEIDITFTGSAAGNADWAATISEGGEHARIIGVTSGTGNSTITVRVDANPDTEQRGFTVSVEAENASGSPKEVSFVQDAADESSQPALTVTATDYNISAAGETVSVSISFAGNAAVDWTASIEEGSEHARLVGVSSGIGNASLTVEVDANADMEQRGFELSVEAENASGSPKILNFVQRGSGASSIGVTASSYTVAANGATITVSVSAGSSVQWSAEASEDFAHLVGSSQDTGNGTLTVSIDPNNGQDRRAFEVTVTPQSGDPQSVGFVQEGAADGTLPALTVTATDYNVAAAGETVSVSIAFTGNAAVDWTASIEEGSEHARLVGVSSGIGNATITVEVDANSATEQRGFELSVEAENASGSPKILNFVQRGSGASSIGVTASSYTVAIAGGTIEVTVSAGAAVQWSAEASEDFAHLVGSSQGTGNGTLTLSIDPNNGQDRRAFEVTVTPQSGDSQSVGFVQEGTAPAVLSVTVTNQLIPHTGGTARLTISNTGGGRMNWFASITESWASISGSAGGINAGTAELVIDENEGGRRTLVVTVTADGAAGSPQTITITQSGAPDQPLTAARVFANKYSASPNGDNIIVTIDVTGNDALSWEADDVVAAMTCVGYEIEEIPGMDGADPTEQQVETAYNRGEWVRLLGTSRGAGDGTVRLQVDANNAILGADGDYKCTTVRWSFQITIRFPDTPELNQTLYFSQDPNRPPSTALSLWAPSRQISNAGETVEANLTIIGTEQVYWVACVSETWAHLEGPATGTLDGTGSVVIRVRVDANAGTSRTFTLTVAENACPTGTPNTAITFTQAAAAGMNIRDAIASESSGNMVFTATITPPPTRPVTVSYTTMDGTATAGLDYRHTSGTLTFAPGTTTQTLSVPILDDSENDGVETFTIMLSSVDAVPIADSEAVGTITNSDPIPSAWLARFGRTVSVHVTDAIESRLTRRSRVPARPFGSDGPQPAPSASMATGSQRASVAQEYARRHARTAVSADNLLRSDGLLVPVGADEEDSRWSAWGRQSTTRFAGSDQALAIDGEVRTTTMAMDASFGRWLAGGALAYNSGSGSYGHPQATSGTITSRLTTFNPFAAFALNDHAHIWGTLGYGYGSMVVDSETAQPIHTSLTHRMAAAGLRGELAQFAFGRGSWNLALRSDAMFSATAADAADGLAESSGRAARVRAGIEGRGSVPMTLLSGAFLEPSVNIAVRYDGGDAERGAGIEAGAGMAVRTARFHIELTARTLALHHAEDASEWGFTTSVMYRPEDGGRGLSVTLGSSWGLADTPAAIWRDGSTHAHPDQLLRQEQRMRLEVGYGLADVDRASLWTPFAAFVTGTPQRSARIGIRLAAETDARASLHIGVNQSPFRPTDFTTALTASMRW